MASMNNGRRSREKRRLQDPPLLERTTMESSYDLPRVILEEEIRNLIVAAHYEAREFRGANPAIAVLFEYHTPWVVYAHPWFGPVERVRDWIPSLSDGTIAEMAAIATPDIPIVLAYRDSDGTTRHAKVWATSPPDAD